jgi:hypothetical protein
MAKTHGTIMAPNRLFHYRMFNEDHLISLLSEGRLKLSRPDKFNDPWDCRVHYRVPTDPSGRERVIEHWKELHRKRYPQISETRRAFMAYGFQSNPEALADGLSKAEPLLYKTLCNQYRIYCLSEKPDAPLLWGHYASSHTGICLEFDSRRAPFAAAEKVKYVSAYPAYDVLADDNHISLYTKSADWSYEAEWRLIAEERAFARSPRTIKTDNDFLTVPSGVLKSVTIGCLTDPPTRRRIEKLVKMNSMSVLVRQATLSPDKYELVITPSFA